ncbi:ion channel [Limnoglobus roseus]|uniref:Potassium channel domain-containing protein n=1 Tax=Limnoglobus roseus TaxID=2598579 RepID=A0A5C1ACU6_9BACT|nr:ion channel [Limnoglobus roseus]QEL15592.1 hypothetical protein PX52LOC_02522 [Limnoglobus roseus]
MPLRSKTPVGLTRKAIECYDFSIVTWTTLEHGDFRPTPESRLYGASEAFVGLAFTGLVISVFFYRLNKIAHMEARQGQSPAGNSTNSPPPPKK